MCLGGFSLLIAALQNTDTPGLVAAGLIVGAVPIAVILHILLAFPSGVLYGWPARRLVAAGYLVTFVLQAPRYLFSNLPAPSGCFRSCREATWFTSAYLTARGREARGAYQPQEANLRAVNDLHAAQRSRPQ